MAAPGPAARPIPRARHSRGWGSSAAGARTRRATRWVKSGLSMMTSASGRAAMIHPAVSPDAPQNHRQAPRNSANADDGEIVDRKRTHNPRRRHRPAADAGERERIPVGRAAPRERRTERIAGFLRRDEVDRQRSRPRLAIHADFSSGTPTKIFAKSAAAVSCAGSATIVAAGRNGKAGKTGACDILDRLRSDGRQIEAAVLARLRRLDENADAGRFRQPDPGRANARCGKADCRCLRPLRCRAHGHRRRPRPGRHRRDRARR